MRRPPRGASGRPLLTAFWAENAFALLTEAGCRLDPASVSVRAGVTVADLDPDHVVPNRGVIVRRGVWYPNLNASP